MSFASLRRAGAMLRRGCRISGTAIKPSRADAYNRG
ncbi:endonuclease, partial [Xanthomonas oryzae pv. oryzae]